MDRPRIKRDKDSLLDRLNPRQREAVLHGQGPLLILAGAGSGKTRVIAHRIAYLAGVRGVKPWNILAVTFTNKAAEEMRSRASFFLEIPLGKPSAWNSRPNGPWIGTFHSTCLRILRQHSHLLGHNSNFVIFDEADQLSVVRECLKEMDISEKTMNPRAVLSRISQAKNELYGPNDYALLVRDTYSERTAQAYARYQEKLAASHALDFDDLLMAVALLFHQQPQILESYQDLWQYILVDEYQDTNHAQYRIIGLLAAKNQNLCVVGDDDQSIYRWRGADIRNILSFEEDYPSCRVIRLEQNYRSTQRILQVASSLISQNKERRGKALWTKNEKGETPVLYMAGDEHDEASFIGQTIKRLCLEEGCGYDGFAILYRTHAQSRVIEEEMRRQSLPYVIIGGVRFYERREVKDMLAYLRFLLNPVDASALKRIINTPARRIGEGTVTRIEDLAREQGISLAKACEVASSDGLSSMRRRFALRDFCDLVSRLRNAASSLEVPDLISRILEDTGYQKELAEEGTEEAQSRIENLRELVEASRDFAVASGDSSLQAFLDSVTLITDTDALGREQGAVTLMTLHSAKGLEFPIVFIAGMEEGIFPHSRSLSDEAELEEERRLCYVGMTRAQKRLYLISAGSRRVYGTEGFSLPSRFLEEIPEGSIIKIERQRPKAREDREVVRRLMRDVESMPQPMPRYEEFSDEPEPGSSFLRPGILVRHPEFGIGKVQERIGEGEEMKVTVSFRKAGKKRLAVKFANLERV